ncbi:membrane protease subunit [Candidatus Pacearchaeota archaeon]|nr:membrane protease subunit [Candidatus Pacearchaeota archaeon]
MEHQHNRRNKAGTASLLIIIILLAFFLWGWPNYKVYAKELSGKAELKEAEWNRQIAIQEAIAQKEAAKLKAEAEVIRAGGIAEANTIIGESITESYLKYRFIEGLNDGNTEVIYVPTEANLPILEARG